jgi:hypothetical protein
LQASVASELARCYRWAPRRSHGRESLRRLPRITRLMALAVRFETLLQQGTFAEFIRRTVS